MLEPVKFNMVCSSIDAKTSPDCLNELNLSTDHLRMVWSREGLKPDRLTFTRNNQPA